MASASPGRAADSAGFARLLPLLRLLAPHRLRIGATVAALLVSAGMVLLIGEGLKRVIDEGFARGSAERLDEWIAALAASRELVAGSFNHSAAAQVSDGCACEVKPAR